jgi:hypothetical protein
MNGIPDDEPLTTRETLPPGADDRHAGSSAADELSLNHEHLPNRIEGTTTEIWPAEALPTEALPIEPELGPESSLELTPVEAAASESPLFQAVMQPEVREPARIPHLGHFFLLLLVLLAGFAGAIILILIALHFHLYGVRTLEATKSDIHYTLGSEAIGYLLTFLGCLIVFPLLWNKPFFAGLQWNAATALRLRWRLVGAAFVCFLLALLNSVVLPGPTHTPIEEIFRQPGAAWLLFGFGVTFAPFFEEMFFRGFLLPALCTAYDWIAEKFYHVPRMPLAENGHPQWSFSAMAIASVVTSLPFAWLHAAQTGYSVGPLLLLVCVSVVLCSVRLWTRSLAASTLVHSSYNFMLFFMMLVGTHGFRHMEKM